MSHAWLQLDAQRVLSIQLALALSGALLLGTWHFSSRQGPRTRRLADGLLVAIALSCAAGWWNFGKCHFSDSSIHYRELFHYYLGAKYFPELGYTRLYECSVVAEAEVGVDRARLSALQIRDLSTNGVVPASLALEHPEHCKGRFSAARWEAFKRDSHYFWRDASWERWPDVLLDHGYNATPVWRLLGGPLASLIPELTDASARALGLIDPALLLLATLAIGWAFGLRTLCLALIFFGMNFPGRYLWTGGAFLRTDWLCALLCGICLARKECPLAAGLALGYATLSRIFPGFVLAALVLKLVVSRTPRGGWGTLGQRRFFAGAGAAFLVLGPLSLLQSGVEAWPGFVANSRKHLSTPLTNNMGWKTVVAYRSDTRGEVEEEHGAPDGWLGWKEHQLENFRQRRAVFVLGLGVFVLLLGLAARRQDDWVVLTLGMGLVLMSGSLTCYYFVGFVAFAFLWPVWSWSGPALALLGALSRCLAFTKEGIDVLYFRESLLYVAFALAVTAALAFGRDLGWQAARSRPA